jgi:hypothetical protein
VAGCVVGVMPHKEDKNDENESDDQQRMYFDFEGYDIEISKNKADKKE